MPWGARTLANACQTGNLKKVTELVQAGHSVNERDPLGYSPLHHAASFNQNDVISLLHKLGADFNARDMLGKLPIMDSFLGLQASLYTICQHYCLGTSLLPQNLSGDTILHDACRRGRADVAVLVLNLEPSLINIKDEVDEVPLMVLLSRSADTEMVQTLLAHGADVNIPDGDQRTSVHYAAELGDTDIMELFLQAKADITCFDDQGLTPLHSAMSFRQHAMVQLLIQAGAKVDQVDGFGETALFNACRENDIDLFELLFQYHPMDIHKANSDGCTPMELARFHGHIEILECLEQIDRGQMVPPNVVVPPLHHAAFQRPRSARTRVGMTRM